jgi:hypothetical protein
MQCVINLFLHLISVIYIRNCKNLEKGDMFVHESYAELQKEYGFLWGSR